jgi:hypothetical protein
VPCSSPTAGSTSTSRTSVQQPQSDPTAGTADRIHHLRRAGGPPDQRHIPSLTGRHAPVTSAAGRHSVSSMVPRPSKLLQAAGPCRASGARSSPSAPDGRTRLVALIRGRLSTMIRGRLSTIRIGVPREIECMISNITQGEPNTPGVRQRSTKSAESRASHQRDRENVPELSSKSTYGSHHVAISALIRTRRSLDSVPSRVV